MIQFQVVNESVFPGSHGLSERIHVRPRTVERERKAALCGFDVVWWWVGCGEEQEIIYRGLWM